MIEIVENMVAALIFLVMFIVAAFLFINVSVFIVWMGQHIMRWWGI